MFYQIKPNITGDNWSGVEHTSVNLSKTTRGPNIFVQIIHRKKSDIIEKCPKLNAQYMCDQNVSSSVQNMSCWSSFSFLAGQSVWLYYFLKIVLQSTFNIYS